VLTLSRFFLSAFVGLHSGQRIFGSSWADSRPYRQQRSGPKAIFFPACLVKLCVVPPGLPSSRRLLSGVASLIICGIGRTLNLTPLPPFPPSDTFRERPFLLSRDSPLFQGEGGSFFTAIDGHMSPPHPSRPFDCLGGCRTLCQSPPSTCGRPVSPNFFPLEP